jgi:hypothetical protein
LSSTYLLAGAVQLNESWLGMFGSWVKWILRRMFKGSDIPVRVRGNRSEVESFAKAISGEKRYIDVANKYGLTDARTYKSKYQLEKSINQFERTTGITWPFV